MSRRIVRLAAGGGLLGCVLLVAASAAQGQTVATVPLAPPAANAIPTGALGDAIRLGLRVVTDTQVAAKPYVGNGLKCSNCHLDAGRTALAAPLVGLTGLFPEYRSRSGRVESMEDRVNDCFQRSMNVRPLPAGSAEMIGTLAHITWLSTGVPVGAGAEGAASREPERAGGPDAQRGKALYAAQCASCGAAGQGLKAGPGVYASPLWGRTRSTTARHGAAVGGGGVRAGQDAAGQRRLADRPAGL